MKKVNAIVVTYNRKKLLIECIDSILEQSYEINKLIIIDNNSTDGTMDLLSKMNYLSNGKTFYKKLEKNIGGAGGFYTGFKEALNFTCDYFWIMDDDTIPKKDALKELINSTDQIRDKFSFVASSVYGENGEFMNVPKINESLSESGYPDWYKYLESGIVKIKEATFVSLLISVDAIKNVGLPIKNYFIWGDDTEYTLRLNKYYAPGYFIGNSQVIHKRVITKNLSIYEETNENRINFYYYMIRNNLINQKEYYGKFSSLKLFIIWQLKSFKVLISLNCEKRVKKFIIIHKALCVYLFKLYDYKTFKRRFYIECTK